MTAVLSGDTSGAVVVSATGEVGIQLGPVIAAVKERLAAQGFALADRIPEVDRTVVVAQSEELVQARSAYRVLVLLGFVLPWVSLGLLAAGVLVASGRARVMIWVGLGLALTMALLGLGVTLGRIFTVAAVSQHLPADVAEAVYDALVPGLYSTAVAVGVLGATSAVVAYLAGPFRGAVTVRRLTAQAVGRTRRGHAARPAAAATDVKDSGEEAVGQETDGAAPQATVTAPE
ncbi:hypothetical protein [Nesterenkonia sandarakina]|uniref:Uncharacterized protein n=1 Tax=Nesterenkonia sandarakina TaxID=272918 RepID=A0A2T0YGS7_9MICC|nr:hypothetical protein [Nesterenkonia sandarakina]PRZ14218.1 hypothetical protein BCL67_11281 [Nesterenkonia sandarakina]